LRKLSPKGSQFRRVLALHVLHDVHVLAVGDFVRLTRRRRRKPSGLLCLPLAQPT
jgi:hypothetical protein